MLVNLAQLPRRLPLVPPRPAAPASADEALAARLAQECVQLTALYRGSTEYGCDPEGGWWIHLAAFPLPEGMNESTTPIIVLVSRDYPQLAPSAFYMPKELAGRAGWKVSDLLPAPDGEPAPDPWSRCAFPAIRWREGDDLERALGVLQAVLQAVARLTPPAEQPGRE